MCKVNPPKSFQCIVNYKPRSLGWSFYEDREWWSLDVEAIGGDAFMSDFILYAILHYCAKTNYSSILQNWNARKIINTNALPIIIYKAKGLWSIVWVLLIVCRRFANAMQVWYTCKVMHKVPHRRMKSWVCFLFVRFYYSESFESSYVSH